LVEYDDGTFEVIHWGDRHVDSIDNSG
jgi:hypothetical protein